MGGRGENVKSKISVRTPRFSWMVSREIEQKQVDTVG